MNQEKNKCRWLNETFGKDYWICNGLFKKCDEEICKKCKDYSPKKKMEK